MTSKNVSKVACINNTLLSACRLERRLIGGAPSGACRQERVKRLTDYASFSHGKLHHAKVALGFFAMRNFDASIEKIA